MPLKSASRRSTCCRGRHGQGRHHGGDGDTHSRQITSRTAKIAAAAQSRHGNGSTLQPGVRISSRVEAKRDALAAESAQTYPELWFGASIFSTVSRPAMATVSHINRMSPSGGGDHLYEVELTARGIEQLLQPDVVIAKELRLPTFKRGANEPLLAWPPSQQNLALQMNSPRCRRTLSLSTKRPRAPTSKSVTVAYWRTTDGRSPRPNSASASSRAKGRRG